MHLKQVIGLIAFIIMIVAAVVGVDTRYVTAEDVEHLMEENNDDHKKMRADVDNLMRAR